MVDLNKLSPAERSAAMRGGTVGWGSVGSEEHVRYMVPVKSTSRRRCDCGCGKRATHKCMANGVCLGRGCELSVRLWVRAGERARP